jgi:pyruvate formate lyase activating enzyme
MYDQRSCHQFGECIKAAPGMVFLKNNSLVIKRELISDPSVFYDVCPSRALIVMGKEVSVKEILHEIEKDIPFYKMSQGGVTLTGGEPFSQEPELKDLIIELNNRGIHVSAETSLHLPWEVIDNYVNLVDLFLADLKHIDSEKFTKYTGGNATLVLNNFKKLDETGRKFIVRIPVIPAFNSSDKELKAIIDFASGLKNAVEINLIPFHALAKEKYIMLGLDYKYGNFKSINKEELLPYIRYAQNRGITTKILN